MNAVKKLSMVISGIVLAIIFSWGLQAANLQTPIGHSTSVLHMGHSMSESHIRGVENFLVVPPNTPGRKSVSMAGGQLTFIATGQETSEKFALANFSLPVGAGLPLHINDDAAEAFYILEGELTVQFEEQTAIVAPGTFVYLPKGKSHAIKNSGKTPVRTLALLSFGS